VRVSNTSSGDVLTTSDGRTLYFSDQEKNKVLCVSAACQAIWTPLTVLPGAKPSAPGKLAGELTTLKRSDGSEQVGLGGRPLYTFSFDHGAGDVNGSGRRTASTASTSPGTRPHPVATPPLIPAAERRSRRTRTAATRTEPRGHDPPPML
jgi:predicted lipoprotein with Yx(FWY)xxD motif